MDEPERIWPDYYEEALGKVTVAMCIEKGWKVLLTCSTCGHGGGSYADLPRERLERLPPLLTMRALAKNAYFERCGHKGAWIDERQEGTVAGAGCPQSWGKMAALKP